MASYCGLRLPILITAATVTGTLVTLVTPAPHCPSLPLTAPWPRVGGEGASLCWLGPAAAVTAVQLRSPRRLRYH